MAGMENKKRGRSEPRYAVDRFYQCGCLASIWFLFTLSASDHRKLYCGTIIDSTPLFQIYFSKEIAIKKAIRPAYSESGWLFNRINIYSPMGKLKVSIRLR